MLQACTVHARHSLDLECQRACSRPATRPLPMRRRLTMAAFTPKAVRGYLPRIQTAAEKLVSKWAAAGDVL